MLLEGALADEAFAEGEPAAERVLALVGVAGQQLEARRVVGGVEDVEDRVLGRDDGGQLGEDEPTDREQVFLALQHAAELGEVRLEPVLFAVLEGLVLEVADHLVDVVLEDRDLAEGLDLDGARQVALGDGGGHFGDGPHLRRQVGGELVDVFGEALPRPGGAGHLGLAAELALDADLAGHRRHLVGEGGERRRSCR